VVDVVPNGSGPQQLDFTTSALTAFSEAELDDMHELIRDQEVELLGEGDTDRAEIADMVSGPGARPDLGRAAWIGDRVVAALFVEIVARRREVGLDLHVDRTLADDLQAEILLRLLLEAERDIGNTLAALDLGDLASEPPDFESERWQVLAGAFDQDRIVKELLLDEGFNRVRVFERLRIEDWTDPGAEPADDAGITIRTATDPELRDLHAILAEAFEDHWGDEVADFEDWWHKTQANPFHERDRMFLARLDGEPAGAIVMDCSRRVDGFDYVDFLGVRRSARGRGVARAMLRHAFAQASALGLRGTELDVDSVSPTGADRLYRAMGMHPVRLVDIFMKNIRWRGDGNPGWSD